MVDEGDSGGWMKSAGGSENAISMASCNPNELFSFESLGGGKSGVLPTTGDTGGSPLIALGEGGGSGEVELPGVGSCERSSAVWGGVPVTGAVAGCN